MWRGGGGGEEGEWCFCLGDINLGLGKKWSFDKVDLKRSYFDFDLKIIISFIQ